MIKEQRLQRILEVIQKDGHATAKQLARDFGVSEITVRRNLNELAERGLLQRAHGGAVIPAQRGSEPPVIQRLLQHKAYKEAIARTAASLIKENESIFIGSGSTTAYLPHYLKHFERLTVVTNTLNISADLAASQHITVVVLGGMMRHGELSLIGHIAEMAVQELTLDKVILGIPAVDVSVGLTNHYLPEVMTDRAILNRAREVILLADHTKVGQIASAVVAPLSQIDTFITDCLADPAILDQIRALGVKVITVDPAV